MQPLSLSWQAESEPTTNIFPGNQQHYRLIDAPVGRYLVGLGRWMAGLPALTADWNWSASWEENQIAGALPTDALLYIGRSAIAVLLPVSLVLIYLNGRSIGGRVMGWLSVLLMGANASLLLHSRRAMAEGPLALGVCLSIYGFLNGARRPWLAALGVALAFNAKQVAIALLPVGLIAVAWLPTGNSLITDTGRGKRKIIIINILIYCFVFGLVTLVLNPIWWKSPIQAMQVSWRERQGLLDRQIADTRRLAPEKLQESIGRRATILIANLYLLPPSFSEAGNYLAQTTMAEAHYLAIPGHNLLRGFIAGGLLLVFTILGLYTAIRRSMITGLNQNRNISLLFLASCAQAAFLVLFMPLPWQRYSIPLVPFVCLWAAFGMTVITQTIKPVVINRDTRVTYGGWQGGAGD